MKTKKDWVTRLQKMRKNVYLQGEKVARDDERMQAVIDTTGMTFDLAEKPEHAELMTATSHLTGEKINRFCHIHQSKADLHKKQERRDFFASRWAAASSAVWALMQRMAFPVSRLRQTRSTREPPSITTIS